MIPQDDAPSGSPEWLLTYGDLMSLLLTFFVMLVSMSELRSENRVVSAVEAMNNQFGHDREHNPGAARLRGVRIEALPGTDPRVRGVRTGRHPMVGGMVLFEENSAKLDEMETERLKLIIEQFIGKAQKDRSPRPHDEASARRRCRLCRPLGFGLRPLPRSVSAAHELGYRTGTGSHERRRRERTDLHRRRSLATPRKLASRSVFA
ncbi:MAG: flagellar motor protein MotB [Pirellulales bacterium]